MLSRNLGEWHSLLPMLLRMNAVNEDNARNGQALLHHHQALCATTWTIRLTLRVSGEGGSPPKPMSQSCIDSAELVTNISPPAHHPGTGSTSAWSRPWRQNEWREVGEGRVSCVLEPIEWIGTAGKCKSSEKTFPFAIPASPGGTLRPCSPRRASPCACRGSTLSVDEALAHSLSVPDFSSNGSSAPIGSSLSLGLGPPLADVVRREGRCFLHEENRLPRHSRREVLQQPPLMEALAGRD